MQVDITSHGGMHMRHAIPAAYLKFDIDGADGHLLQLVRPKHRTRTASRTPPWGWCA